MNFPALAPTWYNLPKWFARAKGIRRFINSIHRRGGKDVDDFGMTTQNAVEMGGVHYYLFPTRVWAEEVIFKEQFTFNGVTKCFWEWIVPECLNPIKREKDCSIILPHNGARIQLGGTDDLSFVGKGGKGYAMSEFSLHKNEVTGFIAPILRQSDATFMANGTLRGRENQLYKMLMLNKNNPEWFVQWLRPEQTKCYCWVGGEYNINPELVDRIGQIGPNYGKIFNVQDDINSGLISMTLARQEYLNEPVIASENGYYEHEMAIAKGERRIFNTDVKYDRNEPVFTFWDLGKGTAHNSTDAMSIWFCQCPDRDYENPRRVNMFDYHESRGRDWAFYAQMLNSKGYWYGNHYAPWDIAKGMAGHEKTNRDYAKDRGIEFQTVSRNATLNLDIEDCRRFWPVVNIGNSAECIHGTELLQSYHEKTDKNGIGVGKPEHDASSNCADSYRTMVRAFVTGMVRPISGRSLDWADEIKLDGYFD